MNDLREEVGTKACVVDRIVKSRMKWAGHMVRMKDERLRKKTETDKQGGCRKPQLRWEDCTKKDLLQKGRRRRKLDRKGRHQNAMDENNKSSCICVD